MSKSLLLRFRNLFEPRALVLLYHRIAEPESDVWSCAVTPANFEMHLQILKEKWQVISLQALTESLKNKTIRDRSIAITFDDGYADNYLFAKPLLEKYDLPATFFISSAHIDHTTEFWWDELEYLILYTEKLPRQISLSINGKQLEFDLGNEAILSNELKQIHSTWKADSSKPVSSRSSLYLQLYFLLKPLTYPQQKQVIQQLQQIAGTQTIERQDYRSMALPELQEMTASGLLDVGMHTATHPALASNPVHVQLKEIQDNKLYLEQALGKKNINILAYPYGNYNNETLAVATELGLDAAFTTEAKPIKKGNHKYKLGRFQVQNWHRDVLEKKLNYWYNLKK